MKIVIAPDSFKESMTAENVCECIKTGFSLVFPEATYCSIPMADGGEGSLEAIKVTLAAEEVVIDVKDAYSRNIKASYLFHHETQTALIEMAKISGLELTTKEERNPCVATTFGVGQAIKDALDKGAKKIVMFIGGSATNDGGAGVYQALGGRLIDESGVDLQPGCEALKTLYKIDNSGFDKRIDGVEFEVACDVDNLLLGEKGATYIFGPQKGVKPEQLDHFDNCLRVFGEKMKSDLGKDIFELKGGGAAGGLGAGLAAFCGATLRNGFAIISDLVKLEENLKDANFVITGEGRIDSQTAHGKVPCGVGTVASKYGVPVIGIAGGLADDVDDVYGQGVTALFSITNAPMTLVDAYKQGPKNVVNTVKNIALIIKSSNILTTVMNKR